MILSGDVKDGDAVNVSAGKQGLTFNGKAVREAA
jgi:ATP-dependent Clp protease ATP-binding subunit ClpB